MNYLHFHKIKIVYASYYYRKLFSCYNKENVIYLSCTYTIFKIMADGIRITKRKFKEEWKMCLS